VQLTALVCLTFISMLSGAQAAFETAGVDTSKAPVLAAIIERADWMMCVLLLLPPLLFMLPMDLRKRCGAYLCKHGAGGEGDEERNRALDVASAANQTQARLQALERQLQQAQQVQQENEQLVQENEQLLQEKEQEMQRQRQRHEQEKEQLRQEKEQEKEQLLQEKEQLLQEKEQEKEQLLQEKEQLQQDNDQLLARLEDQQEPGEQRAATAARRDVYRTFDPAGQEGQGGVA
jgi:hypothetical protein